MPVARANIARAAGPRYRGKKMEAASQQPVALQETRTTATRHKTRPLPPTFTSMLVTLLRSQHRAVAAAGVSIVRRPMCGAAALLRATAPRSMRPRSPCHRWSENRSIHLPMVSSWPGI